MDIAKIRCKRLNAHCASRLYTGSAGWGEAQMCKNSRGSSKSKATITNGTAVLRPDHAAAHPEVQLDATPPSTAGSSELSFLRERSASLTPGAGRLANVRASTSNRQTMVAQSFNVQATTG
eukprot:1175817-Prorocentrum_minimum.AAC.9